MQFFRFLPLVFLSACATAASPVLGSPSLLSETRDSPSASYHQHLVSTRFAPLVNGPTFDAAALIAQLDAAGIRKAAVLSVGYTFGDERKSIDDPDLRTREENDWTSAEVSRFPDRLVAFCSVNPLRDSALAEMERCLALPHVKGLKLHFGNSGVDLLNRDHVARMRTVFAAADRLGAAMVIHMRARTNQAYGRPQAEVFLEQLLPVAPHVPIQIAHMAGAGPGFQVDVEQAFDVFAAAAAAKDPRVANVWFDVATVATSTSTSEELEAIADRIRRMGVERALFGADHSIGDNPKPGDAWAIFKTVPLTPTEFETIARAEAPYMH